MVPWFLSRKPARNPGAVVPLNSERRSQPIHLEPIDTLTVTCEQPSTIVLVTTGEARQTHEHLTMAEARRELADLRARTRVAENDLRWTKERLAEAEEAREFVYQTIREIGVTVLKAKMRAEDLGANPEPEDR